MAYAQNTIISPNASNALAVIVSGLLDDAGWVLEDSGTVSTTYRYEVWKSSAANNQCGYDWYVSLQWNTIGTEQTFDIIAGGAYNSGTKAISQIAAYPGGAPGSNPSPYVEATTGDGAGPRPINTATTTSRNWGSNHTGATTNVSRPWFTEIIPSSAFAYWASITLDHIALFTTINTITANYVAFTLDVDDTYAALPYTNPTPVVAWHWASTLGVSATIVGASGAVSTSNRRNPVPGSWGPWGVPLPSLEGEYLDAYAWRPEIYIFNMIGAGGSPAFDNPAFDGRMRVGSAIDLYQVHQGSIGDTVTIDGGTYVLGRVGSQANPQPQTVAVLVE